MNEPGPMGGERPGGSPLGEPRGQPDRPLLEAFILYLAFYLGAYVAAAPPALSPSRPEYHLLVVAVNLPRALLVLYVMSVGDGLALFGVRPFRRLDAARGALVALGALAVVLGPALAFSALGIENPLFAQARSGQRAGAALIPLILASSMATGYCEELFFRSYLMRRLAGAGLSPVWAAVASSLLFGSGHSNQGVVGLVSGSLVGLFFAWRWLSGRNIHEIAIGHGLYDAAAFSALLYS